VGAVIRLRVAASLDQRRTVIVAVKAGCAIARMRSSLDPQFIHELTSAVSEAFNNIVLHGRPHAHAAAVEVTVDARDDEMVVTLSDFGPSFDFDEAAGTNVGELAESGMGLYIIRSFSDRVVYAPGRPNQLTIFKRFRRP
jgi:serine/threonine-protein kinase RsbW